jgi:hypothetical protein
MAPGRAWARALRLEDSARVDGLNCETVVDGTGEVPWAQFPNVVNLMGGDSRSVEIADNR